ncbi:MAG: OmpH family outer membrane protein [Bacteroidaceae bacterium]|nr:OmpH family outer membrane protein [Bacteroidaceae bacterium]
MKRVLSLIFIIISIATTSFSQVQFGYLSYSAVMKQMPEYTQAQNNMAALRAKYEQEAQRGEDEFQKKFVEFLQGQKEFPATILQKRQAELQNLMDNGLSFRNQAQGLLVDAEKEAMGEVEKILNNAILAVGVELGYAFILNIDENACPFINPVIGVDVTNAVKRKLGLEVPEEPTPQAEIVPIDAPKAGTDVAPVQVVPAQEATPTQETVPTENAPEEH